MELLIKGGTVVTATESFPADVAVDGGKDYLRRCGKRDDWEELRSQ